MGDLTRNFSKSEFACKCGNCDSDGSEMNAQFMDKLQQLRDYYGKPMIITSGFRCLEHNQASGGSPKSMHMQGRAADIQCGWSESRHRLLELAFMLHFGGIGIAKTYIHVDNRSLDNKRSWPY